jgi:putative glutamine amidotransferase
MGAVTTSKGPTVGIVAVSEADGRPYAEIVRRSGGSPWLILPDHTLPADEILRRTDALIISGGSVPGPHDRVDTEGVMDGGQETPGGDGAALSVLKAALMSDVPMLAVCRGMHALNAALGGAPSGDVPGHEPSQGEGEEVSAYHRIYIAPGSKLAAVVGSGGFVRVNSRHHRGIREAQKSPLLLASAYSLDDGVIEALESPDHGWVIGVQFRPERRLELPPHFDRLFQSLVQRAKG